MILHAFEDALEDTLTTRKNPEMELSHSFRRLTSGFELGKALLHNSADPREVVAQIDDLDYQIEDDETLLRGAVGFSLLHLVVAKSYFASSSLPVDRANRIIEALLEAGARASLLDAHGATAAALDVERRFAALHAAAVPPLTPAEERFAALCRAHAAEPFSLAPDATRAWLGAHFVEGAVTQHERNARAELARALTRGGASGALLVARCAVDRRGAAGWAPALARDLGVEGQPLDAVARADAVAALDRLLADRAGLRFYYAQWLALAGGGGGAPRPFEGVGDARDALGSWRFVRALGRGGEGEVYEVESVAEPSRRAALKVCAVADDDGGVAAAAAPGALARRLARLRALSEGAEHVATILAAGPVAAERVWLAMELCAGGDLAARLRLEGLDADAFFAAAHALAGALADAHAAGLVHLDVKPANVLLTERGDVRLADFSLARAAAPGAGRAPAPRAARVGGTLGYRAPEVATRRFGPSADVFSLGVTLHEMATGALPAWDSREPLSAADRLSDARITRLLRFACVREAGARKSAAEIKAVIEDDLATGRRKSHRRR